MMKHFDGSGSIQSGSDHIAYEVKTGLDGKRYAVFRNSYERETFTEACPSLFAGSRIASCGQYDNAYCLE